MATMSSDDEGLQIPFLQLPPNIQDTIARKLSADTYHRLISASNFPQKKKNWILPLNLNLSILGFNRLLVSSFESRSKFRRYEPSSKFESLCSIKIKQMVIQNPSARDFENALELVQRVCIRTEILYIAYELTRGQEDLCCELIKATCPETVFLRSYFMPAKLLNLFQSFWVDKLHLTLTYKDNFEFSCLPIKCQMIRYDFPHLPCREIIRFMESALSGKFSSIIQLNVYNMDEIRYVEILDHFDHRLSVLYDAEMHEYSIFSHKEERADGIYHILISDQCYKTMWLLYFYDNALHFESITYNEFENIYEGCE